jgi:hypothetical protein
MVTTSPVSVHVAVIVSVTPEEEPAVYVVFDILAPELLIVISYVVVTLQLSEDRVAVDPGGPESGVILAVKSADIPTALNIVKTNINAPKRNFNSKELFFISPLLFLYLAGVF